MSECDSLDKLPGLLNGFQSLPRFPNQLPQKVRRRLPFLPLSPVIRQSGGNKTLSGVLGEFSRYPFRKRARLSSPWPLNHGACLLVVYRGGNGGASLSAWVLNLCNLLSSGCCTGEYKHLYPLFLALLISRCWQQYVATVQRNCP